MELSSDLIREFAKNTKDKPEVNTEATVYGTFRIQEDGSQFVQIDGSDTRTPVASTVECKNGDRVTVLIKDHRAIVTGNLTDLSASTTTVDGIKQSINLQASYISDLRQQLANQEITLEDYNEKIAEAKKTATDYIDFTTGTGLVIGASSLLSNVRIYSGGMDIREGTTVLASYTENGIYLGQNALTSVIYMCGNILEIVSGLKWDIDKTKYQTVVNVNEGVLTIGTKYNSMTFLGEDDSYPHGGTIYTEDSMYIAQIYSDSINTTDGYSYLNGKDLINLKAGSIEATGTITFESLDQNNEEQGYSSYKLVAVGTTGILHRTSVSLKDLTDGSMKVTAVFG